MSALVSSGFDCHQYLYLGFLPVKKGRQTLLKILQSKEYTVVFYESVHRIEKTLDEFVEYFGADTPIVVGREITKKFEEFKNQTKILRETFDKNKKLHPEGLFIKNPLTGEVMNIFDDETEKLILQAEQICKETN